MPNLALGSGFGISVLKRQQKYIYNVSGVGKIKWNKDVELMKGRRCCYFR